MTENTIAEPRKTRIGNFLLQEELICADGGETLSRIHITDCEYAWEVVVPQSAGMMYGILGAMFAEERTDALCNAVGVLLTNILCTTTTADASFHLILGKLLALGFTPAVNKAAIKERKRMRKEIYEHLKAFEFSSTTLSVDIDEQEREGIAEQAREVLEESE